MSQTVKDPSANVGEVGSITGKEYTLEKEMATHSSILAWFLEKPMDRGAWQTTAHGVTKSDTTKHIHRWKVQLAVR